MGLRAHSHFGSTKGSMDETPNNHLVIAEEGAYSKEDPQSLYNLLPPSMQSHLLAVKNSFLSEASWHTKKNEIDHMIEYPMVRKLRQSFWIEYANAQLNKRKMQMTRIWQGLCPSSGDFYNIMKKEHFAAFIFTKPIAKETQEKALLELAYEQIENILTSSHMFKDKASGETMLNAAAARVKLDIWKHLEERVNGGIVKQMAIRSEQKNLNVNVETTAKAPIDLNQMRKAEERLAELKEQTRDIETIAYHAMEEDDDQ
jgi:hypothetical protein